MPLPYYPHPLPKDETDRYAFRLLTNGKDDPVIALDKENKVIAKIKRVTPDDVTAPKGSTWLLAYHDRIEAFDENKKLISVLQRPEGLAGQKTSPKI